MCGISGVVGLHSEHVQRTVDEQIRLLAHRGPDSAGQFGSATGVIAQNRLAVIDLETGDPPISNEDGSVGVVLNGEIYNFRDLRASLVASGHQLRTRGDTEVIAHLAEELDDVAVARSLDGMFAFAVWDKRRKRLTLGRDRLGKKPLYYWCSSAVFVFGSEIKAVLAHPAVARELDEDALSAYLTFGYVPTPRTFFRGVRSLPPGHVLTVEPGGEPLLKPYWTPPLSTSRYGEDGEISLHSAASELRTRLETAVGKRLISDVPLGAFLSGGVDSSMVVALIARVVDRPVQTFTIGFDDRDGFDERSYARLVAGRYATDHHEFVVAPNAVDLVERLVWQYDQPFGDSSAIPTFLLNELTRSHVTVALSGDGGDELFAGYERFAAALALERYHRLPAPARRRARQVLMSLPARGLCGRVGSVQRFARFESLGMPAAYVDWLSFFSEETRREALPGASSWALEDFQGIWDASAGAATLDRVLDLNLRTYLLDNLLVKADRMSMAHGLEVRSPFLDSDLLTFALRLPPQLKARGFSLKRVLKAAAAELLPREIIRRRKRGFGVPLDRWFREDLSSYVAGTLGSPGARVREHLAAAVIERLLSEHAARTRDHGQALWLLLTLEVFLRREGW